MEEDTSISEDHVGNCFDNDTIEEFIPQEEYFFNNMEYNNDLLTITEDCRDMDQTHEQKDEETDWCDPTELSIKPPEEFGSYVKKKLKGYTNGMSVSNEMIVRIKKYSSDLEEESKSFIEANKFKQMRLEEDELQKLLIYPDEIQYKCTVCNKDIRCTKCNVMCSYNYFDDRHCKYKDKCHKRHYPYMLDRSVKFITQNKSYIFGKVIKEIESLSDKLLVEMDAYHSDLFWRNIESISHFNKDNDDNFCACHSEDGGIIKKFVYVPKKYIRSII